MFSYNTAQYGEVIYSTTHIYFKENSSTVFDDNTATKYGGAIYMYSILGGNISLEGFSAVVFRNNIAENMVELYLQDITLI